MNQETGLGPPFPGQPMQVFSGIRRLGDGRYLLLTDNGFGSRSNSADAILMFHTAKPDRESGRLLLDERRALVIERDWEGGDARLGMEEPAQFKRVYLIDLESVEEEGIVAKKGFIDLMAIADPKAVAKDGMVDEVFSFPLLTIENVDIVDERYIIVGNDNNYPGSIGCRPGTADNNEMILLEISDLLAIE